MIQFIQNVYYSNLRERLEKYYDENASYSISVTAITSESKIGSTFNTSITTVTTVKKIQSIELNIEKIELIDSENNVLKNGQGAYREYVKLLSSIEDGSVEEFKLRAIAFNVLYPKASLLYALNTTSILPSIEKARFLIEIIKVNPNDLNYGVSDSSPLAIGKKSDFDDGPLLRYAAKNGNLNLVKYLVENLKVNIEACKNPSKLNYPQATALQEAIENGHSEVAKYLIEKKANISVSSNYSEYLIHAAISSRKIEMLELLVANGIPHFNNDISFLWHTTIKTGDPKFVKYLIERGIKIEREYKNILADPLNIACGTGQFEIYKFFVEELHYVMFDPSKEKFSTVLETLCTGKNVEILRYFLDKLEIKDEELAKLHIEELFRASDSKEGYNLKFTLPIIKYLIEERKVDYFTFFDRIKNFRLEERIYIQNCTNNRGKSEFKRLTDCKISFLQRVVCSGKEKLSDNENDEMRLLGRKKMVQLFFVDRLTKILTDRICSDIAEKICSFLDFSILADFTKKNNPYQRDYKKDFLSNFWNNIFLGVEETSRTKRRKSKFTFSLKM